MNIVFIYKISPTWIKGWKNLKAGKIFKVGIAGEFLQKRISDDVHVGAYSAASIWASKNLKPSYET